MSEPLSEWSVSENGVLCKPESESKMCSHGFDYERIASVADVDKLVSELRSGLILCLHFEGPFTLISCNPRIMHQSKTSGDAIT